MVVHYCMYGVMACAKPGPPGQWDDDDRWESEWVKVTCPACLLGRKFIRTFTIAPDESSITCLRCKKTSYNQNDVLHRYCGHCHISHDEIAVHMRHWWITHPDHDDWILRIRVLITDANPRILTTKLLEIFTAESEYMDILAKSYWRLETPEQAYKLLQDRFGENFTKHKTKT